LPELPEVESLVCGARGNLLGHRFEVVEFYRSDIREPIPIKQVKTVLLGQTVNAVTRRGKYILVHTATGIVGIHLGMSGRFICCDAAQPMAKHTHAVLTLDQGIQYRFVDPRRFGRIFALRADEIESHPFFARLGVEPLDPSVSLSEHLFVMSHKKLRSKSSRTIKQFLMDSSIVVGVGNIYASESLWRAKINPARKASQLTRHQYVHLARQIIDVLTEAINAGGTSFRDYRDIDGKPGYFQQSLAVYGRETKPCKRCTALIRRTVQGGRSTYHCPVCQSAKSAD
jgi:formamidopyrimidine-DNA glycosylase